VFVYEHVVNAWNEFDDNMRISLAGVTPNHIGVAGLAFTTGVNPAGAAPKWVLTHTLSTSTNLNISKSSVGKFLGILEQNVLWSSKLPVR
jgi:hypothetical protein